MSETASHASPNADALSRFRIGFITATIAAVFMTVTEALNTGQIGFWPRLAYWLIVMEMGAIIGVSANLGMTAWGRFAARPAIEATIIAVLIALPLTLVVAGASIIFFDTGRPPLIQLAVMFGVVAFVSLIITAINYVIGSKPGAMQPVPIHMPDFPSAAAPFAAPTPPEPTLPRFVNQLPIGLRSADILALSAEDHYLRVHTSAGEALILMRLSDAVGELTGTDGLQTHRSWWVARAAVTAATKGDGKGMLTLSNGTTAPISRTYLKDVSAAGWF
jgi:hypothetical protein